jgi:hypothetical protein
MFKANPAEVVIRKQVQSVQFGYVGFVLFDASYLFLLAAASRSVNALVSPDFSLDFMTTKTSVTARSLKSLRRWPLTPITHPSPAACTILA